jgi:type VI secretion system protein ImpH
MADAPRASSGDLSRILERLALPSPSGVGGAEAPPGRPYEFDFFQAVRRLECAARTMPRVGTARLCRRDEEPVLFGQQPSLRFAPRTIDGVEWCARTGWPRMYVNFLGLLGPNGPLPLHLTEHARERQRHSKDPTFARFLDILNHRMIGLFYRAWALNQLTVSFDRVRSGPEEGMAPQQWEDYYARFICSFFGLNAPGLRGRDAVPDSAKVYFSGRLAASTRTPEGLAAILRNYFRVPTRIVEFVGRWVLLPEADHCRLGGRPESAMLGGGGVAIAGSRVWDCQSTIRIRLGPMRLSEYERMLPTHRAAAPGSAEARGGGMSFRRLEAWVRLYLGDAVGWETQLVLRADEVPRARLGGGTRLGWTSWMTSKPVDQDADNLVLQPG